MRRGGGGGGGGGGAAGAKSNKTRFLGRFPHMPPLGGRVGGHAGFEDFKTVPQQAWYYRLRGLTLQGGQNIGRACRLICSKSNMNE